VYKILAREDLAPVTKLFRIRAPEVVRKAQPGQFVVVRLDERGERIPLTIADWDKKEGSITIIFQEVGASTKRMGQLKAGDSVLDFIGPLGLASDIEKFGTVIMIGGGAGIAPIYPIARALKKAGNKVISIIGARSQDLLFWEEKMRGASHELIVTTDDGSYGRRALVTEPLKERLEAAANAGTPIDRVIAIGPAIMMKFCAKTSQPFGVKTIVSINSIMVDATGMCGACRISVGGQTKFVCVDGPDFDGHQVDWDLLMARQRQYLDEEKRATEMYVEKCRRCQQDDAVRGGL